MGAGDACSAGILVGWVRGLAPERTGALANRLGAYVASRHGATPALPPEIIALAGLSIACTIQSPWKSVSLGRVVVARQADP